MKSKWKTVSKKGVSTSLFVTALNSKRFPNPLKRKFNKRKLILTYLKCDSAFKSSKNIFLE